MNKFCLTLLSLPLLAAMSCSDDNRGITLISPDAITLHKGESYQIEAESDLPIRYGSVDEYYATVDQNGLVTGGFVGQTDVRLRNEEEYLFISVTVEPRSTLYVEPSKEFDALPDVAIAVYGKPYKSTDDKSILIYRMADIPAAPYFFFLSNSEGRLFASGVILADGQENELRTFLGERYLAVDEDNWTYRDSLEDEPGSVYVKSGLIDGTRVVVYTSDTSIDAALEKAAEAIALCNA